ncbi:hypothetical protein ACVWWR_005268 [Bradyrhizobium sp. LM3.2]
MVDSTPTVTGPPSTIRSIRPARSLSTWAASVGETWPERLADGATTAPPKARRIACATGWAGMRIATVSRPAVARSATGQFSVFGTTSVSGPGQNASARPRAQASNRPILRAAARSATCAISGLKAGRPLAA